VQQVSRAQAPVRFDELAGEQHVIALDRSRSA
jgi:hypothetical protein